MRVLAVVGESGSGKGTAIQILTEKFEGQRRKVAKVSSGGILMATCDLWGIEKSRENLQKLPPAMNHAFGEGALSRAIDASIKQHSDADIVMLDAVRLMSDVDMVRSYTDSVMLYIAASKQVRFDRLKKRAEKPGEKEMTWEQFEREAQAETEANVAWIGANKSDEIITNDGTRERLEKKLDGFLAAFF